MNKRMWFIVFIIVMMVVPMDGYSQIIDQKGNLKGIKYIELGWDIQEIGNLNKESMINDIKLKLLQSGIKIADRAKHLLHISVLTFQPEEEIQKIIFLIEVSIHQPVRRLEADEMIIAMSYQNKMYGYVGKNKADELRKYVKDRIGQFIVDYLKANPK